MVEQMPVGTPDSLGEKPRFRFSTNEQLDNGNTVQTLAFDCTLPFEPNLGLYLNPAAVLPLGDRIREITFRQAAILIGDLVVDNNVTKSWIQLSRPDGKPFGVSNVSHLLRNNEFEQWDALTMTVLQGRHNEDTPIDLWGEVTGVDGSKSTNRLFEEGNRRFADHYASMYRVMGEMLTEGIGLAPFPLKSAS